MFRFSHNRKMRKLLDILPECGSQAFGRLCEILSEINPSMAETLRNPQSTIAHIAPEIPETTRPEKDRNIGVISDSDSTDRAYKKFKGSN